MTRDTFMLLLLAAFAHSAAAQAQRIPLNRSLHVELPLSYTFSAGIDKVSKTVQVRLEVAQLTVLHAPLTPFVKGAMGVMPDELNVERWVSYAPPTGLRVDGEWVPFSAFRSQPGQFPFQIENLRFTWTQSGVRLADFSLGSPWVMAAPAGERPNFRAGVYNVKDIAGTATPREALDQLRQRGGAIVGADLKADGLRMASLTLLGSYLAKRDADEAKKTGFYTADGVRRPVRLSAFAESPKAPPASTSPSTSPSTAPPTSPPAARATAAQDASAGRAPAPRPAGDSRAEQLRRQQDEQRAAAQQRQEAERRAEQARRDEVDRHNDQIRQQADQIHRQSQRAERAIDDIVQGVGRSFEQWGRQQQRAQAEAEREAEREAWLEEREAERAERADRARREREAAERRAAQAREDAEKAEKARLAAERRDRQDRRHALLTQFKAGELPTSATRAASNKLYFFAYAVEGSLDGESVQAHVSNVFALGQYPDGTWPLRDGVMAEIQRLSPAAEVVHGPFESEVQAQRAWTAFRDGVSATGMTLATLRYDGRNAQVAARTRADAGPALDFWGRPLKPAAAAPQAAASAAAPLDYWGNPSTKK